MLLNAYQCETLALTRLQLLEAIKETMQWLAENSGTASTEDHEEQKEQLSNLAHPITSRLYDTEEEDDEIPRHGEL